MDDQKVILQMTSTQVQEDGQQAVMELTTAATLHKTKDAAVLEYEETGDSGLTGQAVIELKGDNRHALPRGGGQHAPDPQAGLQVRQHLLHALWPLDMEALPTRVMYAMGEAEGRIELEYHMHVQNQYVGLNRVSVQFHHTA